MKKLGEIKNKLYKKAKQNKGEKALEAAFKLIPLRNFQPFTAKEVNNIDAGATGGYILYSYNKQKLYVGRSDKADLKDRLMQHIQNKEEDYCLFNYRLCKEPSEAYKLECAIYHSIPTEILLNKEHPSSVGAHTFPFC